MPQLIGAAHRPGRGSALGHRARRAQRFFKPAVLWPLAAALAGSGLLVLYLAALATARHQYRELRGRFCAHLVEDFYARNPRLRALKLVDACIELEALTGESPR